MEVSLAPPRRPTVETQATIVVGLGNPILGDDGVGWRVADEVLTRLRSEAFPCPAVTNLSQGGLGLMEHMIGFRKAIVVDAVKTGEGVPGSLSIHSLDALPDRSAGHTTSAHDTSLQRALTLARQMGLDVPHDVWVVGIEARDVDEFSETLSPSVESAVPRAADLVLELLRNGVEEVEHHDLT